MLSKEMFLPLCNMVLIQSNWFYGHDTDLSKEVLQRLLLPFRERYNSGLQLTSLTYSELSSSAKSLMIQTK